MSESLAVEWSTPVDSRAPLEWSVSRPHAVAGCVAGLAAVVALHPLDVVKTRMQVQDGKGSLLPTYQGTWHCFRTIWKREGIPGLYAGLAPCLIASGLSWGLYFLLYNRSKSSWRNGGGATVLTSAQHLYSGVEAGIIATMLTNPIWVLKTRFQLQEGRSLTQGRMRKAVALSVNRSRYSSLRHAVRTIAQEEGIRGFYRGLGPSLLMCANAAIQFAVYEELRRLVVYFSEDESIHSGAAFVIGGISKATASLITYPTQVMRSRLQQRFDVGRTLKYTSMRSAVTITFQREGVRGLYKGLVPSILRTMPQASLMFMVYEKVFDLLKPLSNRPPFT